MKTAHSPRLGEAASTLLITLLTVALLAVVAGQILQGVSSRMHTAQRSAAWNEALTTAEAGVDMTIADITALLPDVRLNTTEGIALGTSRLPLEIVTSLGISAQGLALGEGITLSFTPEPLLHGGEGAGKQEATVMIDVLALNDVLNLLNAETLGGILANPLSLLSGTADVKLIRLRSRGTVELPGLRRTEIDSADARLRRVTLVHDRIAKRRATRATVSREVEVVLRPVFPFPGAVTSGGAFDSTSEDAVFDSFNSALPLLSTSGLYDVTKRSANGDLVINSPEVSLAGLVHGDVRTNGSSLEPSGRITGTVENEGYVPLPHLKSPTWNGSPLAPSSVTGNTTLSAGSLLAPGRYKFHAISGHLRITRGLLLGTNVEIWVTGDVTGRITIDPGVTAKVYVQGNMTMAANALTNGTRRASALQIYGIAPTGSATPTIDMTLGNVTAAIYAPTHNVRLQGDGDFQGAITAASFETTGAAHVHYDEALALNIGPVLRYAIASWNEREL